jgi:hypothetical protein
MSAGGRATAVRISSSDPPGNVSDAIRALSQMEAVAKNLLETRPLANRSLGRSVPGPIDKQSSQRDRNRDGKRHENVESEEQRQEAGPQEKRYRKRKNQLLP